MRKLRKFLHGHLKLLGEKERIEVWGEEKMEWRREIIKTYPHGSSITHSAFKALIHRGIGLLTKRLVGAPRGVNPFTCELWRREMMEGVVGSDFGVKG